MGNVAKKVPPKAVNLILDVGCSMLDENRTSFMAGLLYEPLPSDINQGVGQPRWIRLRSLMPSSVSGVR